MAAELGLGVTVHPDLDESNKHESGVHFQTRIESFMQQWREAQDEVWIACSHGDWIPVAVELTTGQQISPDKGSWTELELGIMEEKDRRILFRKIIQEAAAV